MENRILLRRPCRGNAGNLPWHSGTETGKVSCGVMYPNRVYVGSDHAGFRLKGKVVKWLSRHGYDVKDLGPFIYDPDDDYPDLALKVCLAVNRDKARGILICGSGQGMDRAANKVPGIHASVCWNKSSAVSAKKHGNVNVICLGERFVKPAAAGEIIRTWIEEPFEGELRHVRRINKINAIERKMHR